MCVPQTTAALQPRTKSVPSRTASMPHDMILGAAKTSKALHHKCFLRVMSNIFTRRTRVSQYMIGSVCPSCHGKRLKKEALSVKFAGLDIGEFSQLPLAGLAAILEPIARGEWPEPESCARAREGSPGRVFARRSRRHARRLIDLWRRA